MELERLDKELQLMVLLVQNKALTMMQLSKRLNIPLRTLYRCLDALKHMGFIIEKSGHCYRIDRSSPFFHQITEMVHFTDREAMTMRNILEAMGSNAPEVRQLKEKLARLYDDKILQGHRTNTMFGLNLNNLYRAIRDQRVCILHDYRSSRSATISNRTVEPFQLLSDNEDVRCYEPVSGLCKTFKVERIGHVSVVEDLKWSYADKHQTFHTDLFHFSSEEQHSVTIQMDGLAAQLLREEYPVSDEELTESGPNLWTLRTNVCSWKGIGRFVLGLMGNIVSVEPAEFREYLQTKIDGHKSFLQ